MIKQALFAVTALALLAGAATAKELPTIRCAASDHIDASTASEARKKINAAGFTKVSGLKKGCDSSWHGMAFKDDVATHVGLSPHGLVFSEGN